ncbi:MAG TPA: hypothetical protein VIK31_00960 [Propionibacteriaceae bacterium]
MSDDNELNGTQPIAPEATPVQASPRSSADFLSSTAGKTVLIAGAVLVLLIIAGAVGWFIIGPSSLGGSTGAPGQPTVVVTNPGQSTPGTSSVPASSTVATLPVAPITSRDVFTPRNPFTVIAAATTAASSAGSGTNTDASALDPNEVYLTDIVTVNGVRKAVIQYGGHTYTLAAGDLIPTTTDWKIEKVNANSAVVLFGDVSVTLTPGQGTSK